MTLQNTFEFIGELRFATEAIKEQNFDSGWTKKSLQVSVSESKNNSMYVSLEGGFHTKKDNKVYSYTKNIFGEKGEQLVLDWEDRFDEDTIRSVADFKKTIVDLTVDAEAKDKYFKLRNDIFNIERKEDPTQEDKDKLVELYEESKETVPHRKEFLSTLDAVEYLGGLSEKLKGKKFKVKGNVEASYWNGKTYISYVAQSFELVPDETPNKLAADIELFFTKDSLDEKSFKKERKLYFDTYISQYSRDHKKNVFFPYSTIFNATNHNDENPKHVAHIDIVKDTFVVKGKKVWSMPFQIRFVNGAEVVEVTEADLTDKQKQLVAIGMAEPKDFIKTAFGDRVSENRIYLPTFKDFGNNGNYNEGAIETDLTEDDLVYQPVVKEDTPIKEENKAKESANEKAQEFSMDELPF